MRVMLKGSTVKKKIRFSVLTDRSFMKRRTLLEARRVWWRDMVVSLLVEKILALSMQV